jgi:hypothetical protein
MLYVGRDDLDVAVFERLHAVARRGGTFGSPPPDAIMTAIGVYPRD